MIKVILVSPGLADLLVPARAALKEDLSAIVDAARKPPRARLPELLLATSAIAGPYALESIASSILRGGDGTRRHRNTMCGGCYAKGRCDNVVAGLTCRQRGPRG